MGATTGYHATKYGLVGMWGALGAFVVGVFSYLAMTFWIKCPAAYGAISPACREVEGILLVSVLAFYASMIVGLSSAIVGVYGLVKGEPRLPGLIAVGAGVALILGYRFSA